MNLKDLSFLGKELVRPECILVTAAGHSYVSDFRGGITQIHKNGSQHFFGGTEVPGFGLLKPNGFAMLKDGSFLVAHLGDTRGGIFKIERDNNITNNIKNKITPFLIDINGQPLPPSNFVFLDHQERLWITVSTRHTPRAAAYRSDISDGFIILVDAQGARIVADNIGYTNEVYVTPDGKTLYANATFARELLRYDIGKDNSLLNRKVIARFGHGIYPDGLTMDTQGYLWITSIVSNSVLRVNPQSGEYTLELQDCDPQHLEWVEQAYQQHAMGRPHLDQVKSQALRNISSLAFGGKNQSTVYLGCLLGDAIVYSETTYQGLKPAHWHFDD
jgi:DNA-binding beta-propeller fold protein YncE